MAFGGRGEAVCNRAVSSSVRQKKKKEGLQTGKQHFVLNLLSYYFLITGYFLNQSILSPGDALGNHSNSNFVIQQQTKFRF